MIWVIKDSSIGSTFFDEGAATFLLPHLKTRDESSAKPDSDDTVKNKPLKRMRYLLDPIGMYMYTLLLCNGSVIKTT